MEDYRLGIVEAKFANIIWSNEPLASGKLVEICNQELNWKKSTTYTVLKKLCMRGIFQNNDGVVTSLISKEEFASMQSEQYVIEAFDGSLPSFLAAFSKRQRLTPEDIRQIRLLIDSYEEE